MAKNRDLREIDIVANELESLKKQSEEYENTDKSKEKQKSLIKALCIVLGVIVLGVFVGAIIYVESLSPVSYGPNAYPEEMTAEMTEKHESRLEVFDEMGESLEGVNFVGYDARFNEDGDLIVDGYFRNFTGHEIYDITGNITIETPNQDNIGGAYFEFPKEEFGTLKHGKSRPWRLIFNNDYVNIEITDLSKFVVTTELEYYQK